MQAMFKTLEPRLSGGRPMISHTFALALPESVMAPGLGAIQDANPAGEIGSYPFQRHGRFGVRLVLRAPDAAALDHVAGLVRALIGELAGQIESEDRSGEG